VKAHPELKLVEKDAANDSLQQRSQVEEFVQDKVDLLIISPKEAQPLTEPVAKAMDAGIPVIVVDRPVFGDKYTTFIGADNKLIGKALGQWLVKKLNGKGNVVELQGLVTSPPSQDRHNGFMDGIKGSQLKIVFSADMKWLEANARTEMESALARCPQIDAVYGQNDPGAHGAYLAAQAAGRDKSMIFVGIDGLKQEGRVYVDKGIEAVSFEYPTGGKEAIDTALKILHGDKVDKKITLTSRYFTKENLPNGAPIKLQP
jgi:ribose transport system substrate-binding protein